MVGRTRKVQVKELVKETREATVAKESLSSLTVKASTKAQYRSKLKYVQDYAECLGEELTEDVFVRFLDAMQRVRGGGDSTAESYRDALLFFHKAGVVNIPWISGEAIKSYCKGFKYLGGEWKKRQREEEGDGDGERGAITEEMFGKVVGIAPLEFRDALVVQFGFGLRIGELIALEYRTLFDGDGRVEPPDLTPGTFRFFIPKDKRDKASKKTLKGGYFKVVPLDWPFAQQAVGVIRKRMFLRQEGGKSMYDGNLIFPPCEFRVSAYRVFLKKEVTAVAEEEGIERLKWDGTHVLRHGYYSSNREFTEKFDSNLSSEMKKHYGRKNEERKKARTESKE